MNAKSLFKNIREYENLHIALWLVKDCCWVMSFKIGGMMMIIPTLVVAIHLAWRSRKNISDLFHNIAVCLWISANAIWMTGEFFCNDTLRPYSSVLFFIGIIVVVFYYAVHFPKRNQKTAAESELAEVEEQGDLVIQNEPLFI